MALYLSNELAGTTDGKTTASAMGFRSKSTAYGARVKRYRATISVAAQAVGDVVQLAVLPIGCNFAFGILNTTVSLGTATIAVGASATPGKYRPAAALTAVDVPTLFATAANESAVESTAEEPVYLTVGTAALPASGTLVVDLFVSSPF
jgi:hypothetical protein